MDPEEKSSGNTYLNNVKIILRPDGNDIFTQPKGDIHKKTLEGVLKNI